MCTASGGHMQSPDPYFNDPLLFLIFSAFSIYCTMCGSSFSYLYMASIYFVMSTLSSDTCGQFDCIWSKHSFGSINPVDRER